MKSSASCVDRRVVELREHRDAADQVCARLCHQARPYPSGGALSRGVVAPPSASSSIVNCARSSRSASARGAPRPARQSASASSSVTSPRSSRATSSSSSRSSSSNVFVAHGAHLLDPGAERSARQLDLDARAFDDGVRIAEDAVARRGRSRSPAGASPAGESAWSRATAPSSAARRRSSSSPGAARAARGSGRAGHAPARVSRRVAGPETLPRPPRPERSSSRSGTTSRAAAVGVGARTSAARSQSGSSCSWPTAETIGTGTPRPPGRRSRR